MAHGRSQGVLNRNTLNFATPYRYQVTHRRRQRPTVTWFHQQILVAFDGVDGLPNVATHSIRKGTVTFETSRCTTGLSIGVLTTREGWSLGDVLDRYIILHAPAGDQYASRIASRLPESSTALGTQPPHFGARDDPMVTVMRRMEDIFEAETGAKPHDHDRPSEPSRLMRAWATTDWT
ncbi:hypothetical protein H257_15006 [Aphanomyces astaci]|uniref:Uncharacterized protein n=1 Tax=Aphanomyces astaci TaxID=112090 RepID=W4FNW6_APHAT|nr:hypothetical protein H257_15006 [Aphanomyces astaci]ETV69177.1 hypothetical protein H257_15006 [Aphanomyces astaci]|eukprot:XP_009841279.1 hypothetical protein H257_15006 [Aphanomyces astaci]